MNTPATETTTAPSPLKPRTAAIKAKLIADLRGFLHGKIDELDLSNSIDDTIALVAPLETELAAANDLAKGYAEQNASFAKYISDYSVMSGKYYALALSAVASAERLTAVMSAPLSDPTSKQAWTVFTDTIQAVRESLADIKPVEMTGSLAMLRERVRQLTAEGWTPEHDRQHKPRELAEAGLCYVIAGHALMTGDKFDMIAAPMGAWPWVPTWWKPAYDPLRNLEKGGALLAAAWDRQKIAEKEGK